MDRSDKHSPRIDEELKHGALTTEEANARAELARVLAAVQFLATREFLFKAATDAQAGEDVLERLRRLSPSQRFNTVQEIWTAAGGRAEESAHHG